MWGYSEEQIAGFGLTFGVGAFMLYMLFIIAHLAWESKAGKFGTFDFSRAGLWHDRLCCQDADPVGDWDQVSLSRMPCTPSSVVPMSPSSKPSSRASLSIRSL